jgi:hypothetical protein
MLGLKHVNYVALIADLLTLAAYGGAWLFL